MGLEIDGGKMSQVKRMDPKEFREQGYLQELNRKFLHPLGLALEIMVHKDGSETLSGIWDCRDDPEGIWYDLANSDEERIQRFIEKRDNVENERVTRSEARFQALGFDIEPIVKR